MGGLYLVRTLRRLASTLGGEHHLRARPTRLQAERTGQSQVHPYVDEHSGTVLYNFLQECLC